LTNVKKLDFSTLPVEDNSIDTELETKYSEVNEYFYTSSANITKLIPRPLKKKDLMPICVETNSEYYPILNIKCPIFVSVFSKFALYRNIFMFVSTRKTVQ